MKRLLALLLCLALCASLLPAALAAEIEIVDEIEDGITLVEPATEPETPEEPVALPPTAELMDDCSAVVEYTMPDVEVTLTADETEQGLGQIKILSRENCDFIYMQTPYTDLTNEMGDTIPVTLVLSWGYFENVMTKSGVNSANNQMALLYAYTNSPPSNEATATTNVLLRVEADDWAAAKPGLYTAAVTYNMKFVDTDTKDRIESTTQTLTLDIPIPLTADYFGGGVYVLRAYDTDGDNALSGAERAAVTELTFRYQTIEDAGWIRYFPELVKLVFLDNGLKNLDLSNCRKLEWLETDRSYLESLDVTCLPELKHLSFDNKPLFDMDLSQNPKLEWLKIDSAISSADGDSVTQLDLSNNTELSYLSLSSMAYLSALDLSQNTKLTELSFVAIGKNKSNFNLRLPQAGEMKSLAFAFMTNLSVDLRYCPKLESFEAVLLSFRTAPDFSATPLLKSLNIAVAGITKLDLSHTPLLTTLGCSNNSLTELDLSHTPLLTSLNCAGNSLTELDLSYTPDLYDLDCSSNQISRLSLYVCPELVKAVTKGSKSESGSIVEYYYYTGAQHDHLKIDSSTELIIEEPLDLELEKNELTLPVNSSEKLKATHSDGMPVGNAAWRSSDPNVATVDNNGVVTAHKYGKCTVTASSEGGIYVAECAVQTLFYDVTDPSKYYFKHVYWAAENGITKGYQLEYFAPERNCTREEMMTFLWRMAGKPEPKATTNPFPDVPSSAYYYKAVLWGVENKITNGYSTGEYAGKFGVGLPCTREQAMTFLWRMAGKPDPKNTDNPFSDIKTSDYYYKAVLWASENGIANGYSSGEYAGKYGVGLACLREHMVTFLSRYASKFMS